MAKAAKPKRGVRLNKAAFVRRHAKRHDISRPTVGGERVTDLPAAHDEVIRVLDSVVRETVQGNDIAITGFGTFAVYDLPPRNARNPRTNERVRVPKTRIVKLVPGQAYKEYLNKEHSLPKGSAVRKTPKGSAGTRAALRRQTATQKIGAAALLAATQ